MELVIDKVKYSKGRTTIESHEGIIEDPEESDSKTSKSPPTDKFIKALQDLDVDVREICELKDDSNPITVIGLSLSYSSGVMGADDHGASEAVKEPGADGNQYAAQTFRTLRPQGGGRRRDAVIRGNRQTDQEGN